jgi:hypothetical protein
MLVRYRDIDLPTFDSSRPLLRTHAQFMTAGIADKDQPFLRHTRIYAPGTRNIHELLSRTEDELEAVANFCGAMVLPHTFGLYKIRLPKDFCEKRLLPVGYVLAAEVVPIASPSLTVEQSVQIGTGLSHYYRTETIGMLTDITPKQFKFGSIPILPTENPDAQTDRREGLWLHDIEPRHTRVPRT